MGNTDTVAAGVSLSGTSNERGTATIRRVAVVLGVVLATAAIAEGRRHRGVDRVDGAGSERIVATEARMNPLLSADDLSARALSESVQGKPGPCPAFVPDIDPRRALVAPSSEDGGSWSSAARFPSPPVAARTASLFGVSIDQKYVETRRRADHMARGVPLDEAPLARRYPNLHADLFGWKTAGTMDRVDELIKRLTFVDRSDQLSDILSPVVPLRPKTLFLNGPLFIVDPAAGERRSATLAAVRLTAEVSRCGRAVPSMRVVRSPL